MSGIFSRKEERDVCRTRGKNGPVRALAFLWSSKKMAPLLEIYGASPFKSDLCSERWIGDNDALCVCSSIRGPQKGQCTVSDRGSLFCGVFLYYSVKRHFSVGKKRN